MRGAVATLREATVADARALLDIYTPYVTHTAVSFELEPPSLEEFARRIASVLAQGYPYIVAEQAGRLVGYVYCHQLGERGGYAPSVEISIYVVQGSHRSGLGRRLLTALEQQVVKQGVVNAYACITVPESDDDPYVTRDSVAFHSAMGYRLVSMWHRCGMKFGRWYSVCYMEKILVAH